MRRVGRDVLTVTNWPRSWLFRVWSLSSKKYPSLGLLVSQDETKQDKGRVGWHKVNRRHCRQKSLPRGVAFIVTRTSRRAAAAAATPASRSQSQSRPRSRSRSLSLSLPQEVKVWEHFKTKTKTKTETQTQTRTQDPSPCCLGLFLGADQRH